MTIKEGTLEIIDYTFECMETGKYFKKTRKEFIDVYNNLMEEWK